MAISEAFYCATGIRSDLEQRTARRRLDRNAGNAAIELAAHDTSAFVFGEQAGFFRVSEMGGVSVRIAKGAKLRCEGKGRP